MGLRVLEPGLYSLPVGRGRVASRHLGVPIGGPADFASCALGNAMVGNEADALALEVSFLGPTLIAEVPSAGVVYGAPFEVRSFRAGSVSDGLSPTVAHASGSDGQSLEVGRTFNLAVGESLKIGGTALGCRAYLCVVGGFVGRQILGSPSALEPLRKGALLECRPSKMSPRYADIPSLARRANETTLRVLPGLQRDWFDASPFFAQTYTVSEASNRMGLRLKGTPLVRPARELTSEPVAPGAVQITNDGLPVILGVDGQTIGGYPKIAHVIRADLDLLGQLRPGTPMRFVEVSFAEAEIAQAESRAALGKYLPYWRAGAAPEFG